MIAGQSSIGISGGKIEEKLPCQDTDSGYKKSAVLKPGGSTRNFKQNWLQWMQTAGAALPFDPFISPLRDS
jgi:hypothetical protein